MTAQLGIAVALATLLAMDIPAQAQGADADLDAVATQLRRQGYRCETPLSGKQNVQLSKPDEVVWDFRCANAVYRVRFIPQMAAKVELVE